jgi:hypothetical protein
MTRKTLKIDDSDLQPRCENCTAGQFDHPRSKYGLCHLFPMHWATDGDGASQAVHSPAVRDGWCLQFRRKGVH